MTTKRDSYRIDSHKLLFHPRRVAGWLEGENVYPLYAEISPSGACNHRCSFCAVDYLGYQARFLATGMLKERLAEMGALGVASVMYGGEGEPLLHREIAEIIGHSKRCGIDVALTSNGVLLTGELFRAIGASLSWLKISINAGTPETYAALHRTGQEDFRRVIGNLERAVAIARGEQFACTIGAQMILLPENAGEVIALAAIAREIGLNYLVVKPYSQHHQSNTRTYERIDYADYQSLAERLAQLDGPNFSVIFRANTMAKLTQEERGFGRCLALPFWSYIDAAGNVWGCSSFIGDDRFCYGNINDQGFAEIWAGPRRRASLDYVGSCLDTADCRRNCRMDEINRYLWELTHPSPHMNFI